MHHSYSNATRHQRRKAVVIGYSHLNRINKLSFKNDNVGHVVYVKCFSGSNEKQLNYYTNSKLLDEQPYTVIAHVGSNVINKFNHSKVDVEDLAQRITDIGKKQTLRYPAGIYLFKVNNRNTRTRCEICSKLTINTPERRFLVRKNHEVNEVIKNVNNLLRTPCLEQGFAFICNSAIARTMP